MRIEIFIQDHLIGYLLACQYHYAQLANHAFSLMTRTVGQSCVDKRATICVQTSKLVDRISESRQGRFCREIHVD